MMAQEKIVFQLTLHVQTIIKITAKESVFIRQFLVQLISMIMVMAQIVFLPTELVRIIILMMELDKNVS